MSLSAAMISLKENVDGVEVKRSQSVFINKLESFKEAPVISHGKIFFKEFDLSKVVDFLVINSGKGPFSFIREGFIFGDIVRSSASSQGSKDGAGLGEDSVQEFRV